MISPIDALVLASTKLRTRKIRTGMTVGISGILFGLLIAGVVMVQGLFSSAEQFSQQGLGSRYIMSVSQTEGDFDRYDNLARQADNVAVFEKEHAELVAQKTAEAKKLGIEYDPELEDPSPIKVDPDSKEKYIEIYDTLDREKRLQKLRDLQPDESQLDIKAVTKDYSPIGYPSASVPLDIDVTYMKEGRETSAGSENGPFAAIPTDQNPHILALSDSSITKSFISSDFDASKGEIPVVIPYGDAEKMLGLKPLKNSASPTARLDRAYEVRDRIGEVTEAFCYRNQTSQQLLAEAQMIEDEIKTNQSKPGFVMPSLRYSLPAEDSCGAVEVASDTRSAEEKRYAENRLAFDKQFNGYQDPEQHKIVVRGVGVAPDMESSLSTGTMGGLAASLLMSYTESYWSIPDGLLADVDSRYKPSAVFERDQTNADRGQAWLGGDLVEFGNFDDAQRFYKKYGCSFGACGSDGVSAYPYGSSSLLLAEARGFFDTAVNYAVIFVSVFAMIILAGTIGRTIADGRKESAVFRAIGAKRSDIFGIYSTYTLLLALRIVVFALALGILIAWLVDIWQWQNATVGAQLAFGALDKSLEFHFFDLRSPYILLIIGAMIVAALLAMVLPILRAMRRDPIQDMRDDN